MIPSTSYHNLKRALAPDTITLLEADRYTLWYSVNGQEGHIKSPQYDLSSSNGLRFMPMDEHIKSVLRLDREITDIDRIKFITLKIGEKKC
jgi:hypothetical protein